MDPITKKLTFPLIKDPIYTYYLHDKIVKEKIKDEVYIYMKKELIPNN